MNKIESGEKLDFNQVLIRPKRSYLNSRSEVELNCDYTFKYSTVKWNGVPIIAANMDSTGTFGVYRVLSKFNIVTAMNKFYTLEDYRTEYYSMKLDPNLFMVSTGIQDEDF